jgi:TRAP-type C4-dicarboxylate transport system permease small subunit
MKIFKYINDGLSRSLFLASMVGGLGILVIICMNVFARYVFNAPFHWAEEISAILLVLVSLFPAAELWKKGIHINFEIIPKIVSPRNWKKLQVLIALLSMIYTGVLTWQAILATYLVYVRDMKEPSLLGTPLWIPYSCLVLGIAALFLALLSSFWNGIRYLAKE